MISPAGLSLGVKSPGLGKDCKSLRVTPGWLNKVWLGYRLAKK